MDRREHPRHPIRLRVAFKSIRALINEFTTSVSKGGATICSGTAVEVGELFVFELASERHSNKSIEIEGRVVHCTPRPAGRFDVGVEFVALSSPRRVAVTRFLDEVFAEALLKRHHARMPVNLVAQDFADPQLHYLVHDLSRGGLGLKFPCERAIPPELWTGDRLEVIVRHDGDTPFTLPAAVAWLHPGDPPQKQASVGLRFEALSEANQRLVDALLYLHRPEAILLRFLPRAAAAP